MLVGTTCQVLRLPSVPQSSTLFRSCRKQATKGNPAPVDALSEVHGCVRAAQRLQHLCSCG
eukprot:scaffold110738_cov19-Tisochrysis_lutea.AAC.3